MNTNFATQSVAESTLKKNGARLPIIAKAVADQLAVKFNSKLHQPKVHDDRIGGDSEKTSQKFGEELMSNGVPQLSDRWKRPL